MKLSQLSHPSILILGLGREGQSTWRFLRAAFPEKILGAADRLPLGELPPEAAALLRNDSRAQLHLGPDYLTCLADYDVIVKTPGIPVTLPEYRRALAAGQRITSQTDLFFSNASGTIIGVTGTKGKSTTASLIHSILSRSGQKAFLVGNIGAPALDLLPQGLPPAVDDLVSKGNRRDSAFDLESQTRGDTVFVYELSSHQLEGLRQSPPIAVLLNVVPEHLDYYESFEQYVAAKENITRYQTAPDWLVYDCDHAIPREIASRSPARRVACSLDRLSVPGCAVVGEWIACSLEEGQREEIMAVRDVPLPGRFNLLNVAAAVAVGKILGVKTTEIAAAVRGFQPLEHRLERVGTFGGITYYNDSIATVPEATMAALDTLGEDVETILLGGTDRHLDFSALAKRLLQSRIQTVILFPPTGERIWRAVCEQDPEAASRFRHFSAASMEEAVAWARKHTAAGKICLHSPASPSFGLFRDYRDRGEQFKRLVSEPRP
ncbi:MAG: UDP-N-acetylmuramoylalanine--D-glutamate ligase [Acidobacteria bacterium RIFCSPLOWO2_02_FULL_61_28]|nr:MAG: UDP-N-acetylmuramoylalanine--D-glutamate ligase [Acidobacteria bacterium RIFCSPLOWO2_02_FULL_61_28]